MQFYVPLEQRSDLGMPGVLLVRTRGDPAKATLSLELALRNVLPAMGLAEFRALSDRIRPQTRPLEMGSMLFGTLALLTMLVACLGAYANASQSVVSRQREIAIRLAIGASPQRVALTVVRRAIVAVGAGLLVGTCAGWMIVPRIAPDATLSQGARGVVLLLVTSALFFASGAATIQALRPVFQVNLANALGPE